MFSGRKDVIFCYSGRVKGDRSLSVSTVHTYTTVTNLVDLVVR